MILPEELCVTLRMSVLSISSSVSFYEVLHMRGMVNLVFYGVSVRMKYFWKTLVWIICL